MYPFKGSLESGIEGGEPGGDIALYELSVNIWNIN
jgi:hypothetical protein